MESITLGLKIIVIASIFFVWVVRYDNIIKEFNEYQLPSWLRDFVGILKLILSVMLLTSDYLLNTLAATGIAALMCCAFLVHIKVKHPIYKMAPSFTLMAICIQLLLGK